MTLPTGVRAAMGLAEGDLVDVKVTGRRIVITPTPEVDRSKFRTANDEYTPEQRRIIDARLAKAEKGPFFGPFKNGTEVAAFMKKRQHSAKLRPNQKSRNECPALRRVPSKRWRLRPCRSRKAFIKQLNFLVRNLHHPSLRAKKYDEANDRWQARINDDWRFSSDQRTQVGRTRTASPS